MKFLQKYGTRSNEVRRAKRELYFRLFIAGAVLFFFAAMVLITRFSPRLDPSSASSLPGTANVGDPLKNPQLIRLRGEVDDLHERFKAGQEGGQIDLEDLELLEKAIARQREVIRLRGSEIVPKVDSDRMEELQGLYDEQMGLFLIAQSLRQEDQAKELQAAGRFPEALEELQRARNLQQQVNEQYPRSSARNPSRLHQMNNTLLTWETQPLADRADQLREQAFALVGERRYGEAKEVMQTALAAQQNLNQSHRNSRFASLARLKRFEDDWKSVQAAEDADRVRQLMQEAHTALATEQQDLAFSLASEAESLQRQVVARFPGLSEARPQILDEIEILKDTSASLPGYQKIRQSATEVRRLLREREMEPFGTAVSEWLRATQQFLRNYPKSRYGASINDREVVYLHEKRTEIPTLLETLYANLLPVSGHGHLFMYRTEVPQSLYSRVTGKNPSNLRSPQHPVDSVTWAEAREFTELLSWILARPVRLPRREHYLNSIGSVEPAGLGTLAWSSQNTDRETKPTGTTAPNQNGFFDLLGNVAEWLDSDPPAPGERVLAIGGSVRDNLLRLANIPEEPRDPAERNRFVGFRFAVEITQSEP